MYFRIFFCPKQGQGFKHSAAHLYPNMGRVPPPPPPRGCGTLAVNAPVKGYQECRFDVKEGEDFKVSNKICEKGRAF